MKKISYFGKEYTVSDDIKWVATSEYGNVIAFTEEPKTLVGTWIADDDIGSYIDSWGVIAGIHWKNSLRKVEDILVKDGHPHADLMLKYAMIAQYDAKPWKYFEFETSIGWNTCSTTVVFNENVNYRLKPQEPVVQVGQTWVSKEGVGVAINVQSNKEIIVFTYKVGGVTHITSINIGDFLQNFKRKE